jgi:hypothetical protein
VATFYDIDKANARLLEVEPILETLRAQRAELVALRDRLLAGRREAEVATGGRSLVDEALAGEVDGETPRVITVRIQALIDQMQAGVEKLDAWSIQLRDIETGLIDFPALVAGRQVWLCWRLGEPAVENWHELTDGVAGRRPLAELE